MHWTFTSWEAHDVKDAVQLVMVVRVTGLDVLLATVEYGLRRQQLCEDAANRPDVWWKSRAAQVRPAPELAQPVANVLTRESCVLRSHRWLWCSAEPRAEAQVLCTRRWPPQGQDRLKASAVNWRGGQTPYQLENRFYSQYNFSELKQ